ncbi:MAG: response regulator [Pseudomonadota bacterium]
MIAVESLDFDFRESLLVVDGARATRRLLSTLLARKMPQMNVVVAETAAAALHLVATQRFSLITTATNLPDMDGRAFAEEVHNRIEHSETPVVIVSGDGCRRSGTRFYGKGITGFFDKSEGFRRLIDYLTWLTPSSYESSGRVLCATHDEVNRFNNCWQQLAQCDFNVLQACGFRDVVATLRSTMVESATPLDLLVVETDRVNIPASLELIFQVRHELHMTPNALPIMLAVDCELE